MTPRQTIILGLVMVVAAFSAILLLAFFAPQPHGGIGTAETATLQP
jgi:hypothetical protein